MCYLGKMAFRPHDKNHRDLHEDVKPPNSRLFILCGKGIKEDSFKEAFEKFGTVEDIWIVKDRKTNEDKGLLKKNEYSIYSIFVSQLVIIKYAYS
jgi:ERCC4-type nuclease